METQSGGKLFAKGAYGCIFHEPLKCKGKSEKKIEKNSTIHMGSELSKLLGNKDAEIEFDIAKRIQQIPLWKQYYLVAEAICEPAPLAKQTNSEIQLCPVVTDTPKFDSLRLLKLSYGGTPLTNYRMNFQRYPFYDFAKHLIEGFALLTLHGIVHLDLHSGNILVDNANIPRAIDFNLSIDTKDRNNLLRRLKHSYQLNLSQESSDFMLVNAVHIKKDGYAVIRDIVEERQIVKLIRTVLGVTQDDQRTDIEQFFLKSPSAQKGDLETWFDLYWPVCDSWAVGTILVKLLSKLNLWPSFDRGDFRLSKDKLFSVLRKMCNMSPIKRYDCVQALAELEPENYIIRKYAGPWLKKRPIT
jgi:serine/threonine protein kinase